MFHGVVIGPKEPGDEGWGLYSHLHDMRIAIQLFGVVALSVLVSSQDVEQTSPGPREQATILTRFEGLGVGFEGPQGTATQRNPSDNSLAVGPNHIVQTVNSRMAIFTKKGRRYPDTGRALYGLPIGLSYAAARAVHTGG